MEKLKEEEDDEEEPAIERRREQTDFGSDLAESDEHARPSLPCISLGFGNDRRSMSRGRNVSPTIFITSMSGMFHFRRPPGLRLAFDVAERNEKFGRI